MKGVWHVSGGWCGRWMCVSVPCMPMMSFHLQVQYSNQPKRAVNAKRHYTWGSLWYTKCFANTFSCPLHRKSLIKLHNRLRDMQCILPFTDNHVPWRNYNSIYLVIPTFYPLNISDSVTVVSKLWILHVIVHVRRYWMCYLILKVKSWHFLSGWCLSVCDLTDSVTRGGSWASPFNKKGKKKSGSREGVRCGRVMLWGHLVTETGTAGSGG